MQKIKVSKSNIVEILSILYFIAALQVHNWFHWVLFSFAAENLLESIVWSALEHKKQPSSPTSPTGKEAV